MQNKVCQLRTAKISGQLSVGFLSQKVPAKVARSTRSSCYPRHPNTAASAAAKNALKRFLVLVVATLCNA